MSESNAAHDYFMPVVRQNLAAAITNNAAGLHRAQIQVALKSVARLKDTDQFDIHFDTSQPVQLYGPGDILGFDSRVVVRTDPKSDVGDFEPNYFPAIEFTDADFVWQFTADIAQVIGAENDTTSNGPQDVKLTPWIALIVLVSETRGDDIQAEFTEGAWSERNLPRHIVVDTSVLPDLAHAWRWAHMHITGEANLSQENLEERLRTNPEGAVCRLLCPRRLRPGTRYTAFVVPTFKLGVLAGRGEPLDPHIDALQPAWNPGEGEIELPYYYRWEFGTGMRGDFEHLVRLLEPRRLKDLGTRDIDCTEPGFIEPMVTRPELDPPEQHYLGLEGALQALDTRYTFWGMDAFVEIQETTLIRNVEVRALPSRTSLHISWRTTEGASSHIEYGESEAYGSIATPSTGTGRVHEVNIEGLIADQAYHFKIVAQTDGATPVETEDGIFQLPGRSEFQEALADLINRPDVEDKVSPEFTLNVTATEVIENITGTVLLSGSEIQITWCNDSTPCTSAIEYGISNDYGQITEPTEEFVTEHKFTLAKLAPGKMYHFKVVARTEDGTIYETQDGTFQMPPLPWVVPPIYGRWHYGRFNKTADDETLAVIDAENQVTWIDVLNLDPRHRTAAGLGGEVVRQQQEGLMASAWEQLGAIESANDILRRAQFGRDTSLAMFRRLEQLSAEAFLLVTQAAQKRVLLENPEVAGKMISAAHFLHTQTRLNEATRDPAFRRIMRARGPIRKRQGAGRSAAMLSRLAEGKLEAAGPPPKPLGTTRLCDITRLLPEPAEQEPTAPTLTLSADPPVVSEGDFATLEWVTTDATSCEVSGAWSGSRATSGTERVGPITAASTYTLSCAGPGGGAVQSVTIQVTPTLSLTADPDVLPTEGGDTTLRWSTRHATSCEASGAWSGTKGTSGDEVRFVNKTSTFTLECKGPGGQVIQSVTVEVEVPGPPTASLSADRLKVDSGGSVTLTWSSTNADTCTATSDPHYDNWSGAKPLSGRETVGPLMETSTFTLKFEGPGGQVDQSVTIDVPPPSPPTASLSADRLQVEPGGFVTLTWSSTNADTCTAASDPPFGNWSGTKNASGEIQVGPLTETSTFNLTCSGPGGDAAVRPVIVTVLGAPSLKVGSIFVDDKGTYATLVWSSTNANSCTASGAWSGSKQTSDHETVGPLKLTSRFVLTWEGPNWEASRSVTVQVRPPGPGPGPGPVGGSGSGGGNIPLADLRHFDSVTSRVSSAEMASDLPPTFALPPFIGDPALAFCDEHMTCEQINHALDNHNPFADIDLPDLPDPQSMGDIVCSTLEGWLEKEDDVDEPEAQPPGFIQSIKDLILPELDPNKTILDRTKQRLRLRGDLTQRFAAGFQGDPLDPLRWAPNFPQPMYEPLRDISHDLLIPGVERIRQNTIGLLKTNRRFMESYMCGLNHEFAGELLWRGYPTDQRGSYFRQFWDVSEYVPRADLLDNLFAQWLEPFGGSIENVPLTEKAIILWRHLNKVVDWLLEKWLVETGATKLDDLPDDRQQLIRRLQDEQTEAISEIHEEDINELVEELTKQELLEEMLKDITPLTTWGHNPLGNNQNRPAENLVLVIRGDLLKRYPNALVYAIDAVPVDCVNGESVPGLPEYLKCYRQDDEGNPVVDEGAVSETLANIRRIFPLFRATLPPDLTFFGFPFSEEEAIGSGINRGKFLVFEERVSEARFGLDVPTTAPSPTDGNGGLTSWDDLSWYHFELGQEDDVGKYLDKAPTSAPVFSFTHDGKSWQESTSSATRAWITLQKPVRIALHARQLIPKETEQPE